MLDTKIEKMKKEKEQELRVKIEQSFPEEFKQTAEDRKNKRDERLRGKTKRDNQRMSLVSD